MSSPSSSQQQIRRKPGQKPAKSNNQRAAPAPAAAAVVEQAAAAPAATGEQTFTHIVVLDFEAQCRDRPAPAPRPQEIVEFPLVVVDVATRQIVDEFHTYVKPTVHPTLFPFTTTLTGITQEQVDGGIELDQALAEAATFIAKYNDEGKRCLIVTCGHWDLRTALRAECSFKHFTIPVCFRHWCNIKLLYQSHFGNPKQQGMDGMLASIGLDLVGRHHSGIDDARNIARIAIRLLNDGVVFERNGSA